jgi:Flp pilus assembly protein TadD
MATATPVVSDCDADRPGSTGARWVYPALVACLTFAAYLPVLQAEFVNWDDDHNIVNNPHLRGVDLEHIVWMFTASRGGHYHPLTWLSLATDRLVWGLENPGGFHLTSLLIHTGVALAVYVLALRLLTLISPSRAAWAHPAAAFAALLFAVHPLRAESVAWVTERRDVLAGFFFVLSVGAYVKACTPRSVPPHSGWYVGAILLCALSLLCKAHAATLVGVLLLLDVYPLGRLRAHPFRALIDKIPFILLGAVFGWRAVVAQAEAGALYPLEEHDLVGRVAQGLYGHAFYLVKTLVPLSLGPLYPIPERSALVGRLLGFGVLAMVLVPLLGVLLRRRFPPLLWAWAWYVIVLLPVSGLMQSGLQVAADRYSYLSCLGWAIAGGALFERWLVHVSDRRARLATAGAVASMLTAVLVVLTWRQAAFWRDSVSLWQRGTTVAPRSAVAHANLGDALMHGRDPNHEAALQSYRRALELDPADAKAHNGAAGAALAMGRAEVALEHLEKAVLLDPTYAFARYNLGFVLAGYRRLDEAIVQYRAALRITPGFADAARRLAELLIEQGRYANAVEVLRETTTGAPTDPYVRSMLAWLLATAPDAEIRDGGEALTFAEAARQLSADQDPWVLDSHAAALAEAGRFDEAVRTARAAQAAAEARGLSSLWREITERVELYRSGRPFRIAGRKPGE